MTPRDGQVTTVARTLAEIARALESADDPQERVLRVLRQSRALVAYERCAVLKAVPGAPRELIVTPETPASEYPELERRLTAVLRMVSEDDEVAVPPDGAAHLTLPIMGLDQAIGVIRLTHTAGHHYDTEDVRLLSVVAAQIGAYWALLRLHEVQRNLVAVVSHDLRTPLSVITMAASSLLRQITDPDQSRALERALRNAQRATHIINDLLDVSHARVAGGISITPRHTDLREILIDLVEDQRMSHRERDVRFVDRAGRPLHGHWDPDRLAQLAMNLIGNAMNHGDPTRPVTVTLDVAAARAIATVHNFGTPIPAEALSRIFDPFSGRDRRRRRGGGIGLGLYIVDQIARAHDGEVAVRSDADDGTCFTVTIPMPAVSESRAPASRAAASSSPDTRSSPR